MCIVDLPACSSQVDSLLKRSFKGESAQQEVVQSFRFSTVMVVKRNSFRCNFKTFLCINYCIDVKISPMAK